MISIVFHRKVLLTGFLFLMFSFSGIFVSTPLGAQTLKAGTGKSNITADCGNVHDSLYVKALVLKNKTQSLAIITLDVVAIGTIGYVPDDFYGNLRKEVKRKYGIAHVLVSATHNHWDGFLVGEQKIVDNVGQKALLAVGAAMKNLEPVRIGAGSGYEERFAMNRRVELKDGTVFTIRHANPNPPDSLMTGVGEIDPEIGILRLDRYDGTPKAVLFNYACHPYTGVPGRGVTAEYPGFACYTIEKALGRGGMAFFLQGAAGDITEILYKNVHDYRDSEPFGNMLAESVLTGWKNIRTRKAPVFKLTEVTVRLPLRKDIPDRLKQMNERETRLLKSLRGTSLNMKTFIPLYIQYSLSPVYPSYYAYRYLQERSLGNEGLRKLDEENRRNIEKYIRNMLVADKLAQIEENKAFLIRKQEEINNLNKDSIDIPVEAIRLGEFFLITFPGEPFAETGIEIKKASPYKYTFLAGYSNGYIHYAPTSSAYPEGGYEVMNTLLAPEWKDIYENEVMKLLEELQK